MPQQLDGLEEIREAAAEATGRHFGGPPVTGYDSRSTVVIADDAVLKIYGPRRGRERCRREAAGLRAASHADDLRVPAVLADVPDGPRPWLVTGRLAGRQSHRPSLTGTVMLGQVAARLHSVAPARVDELREFDRRLRVLPAGTTRAHTAARLLDDAVTTYASDRNGGLAHAECGRSLVHGDLSARNVLLEHGLRPAVIDFENTGAGCPGDDLGTLVLHDCLLGERPVRLLLDAYTAERGRLGHSEPLSAAHVAWHLALRARWIMQWSISLDPAFTTKIRDLTPVIRGFLDDPTRLR